MSASKTNRLDTELVERGLVASRSQATSFIKLGKVKVDGQVAGKPGQQVRPDSLVKLSQEEQYVSRAGLKLESVANGFNIDFSNQTVLDVGSSTGGFTDYSLKHGARKVIAVDVGTDQLHPSLRGSKKVELHEKTDIRDFKTEQQIDLILIDVSFISLREILPAVSELAGPNTKVIAMVKPQFEARNSSVKHKGVIKNDSMRRKVLKDFEDWVKNMFYIAGKADSKVAGAKGNLERFYLLKNL